LQAAADRARAARDRQALLRDLTAADPHD
jgi:hypothetical protein